MQNVKTVETQKCENSKMWKCSKRKNGRIVKTQQYENS